MSWIQVPDISQHRPTSQVQQLQRLLRVEKLRLSLLFEGRKKSGSERTWELLLKSPAGDSQATVTQTSWQMLVPVQLGARHDSMEKRLHRWCENVTRKSQLHTQLFPAFVSFENQIFVPSRPFNSETGAANTTAIFQNFSLRQRRLRN